MANKFDIDAHIERFDQLVESEGFLGAIRQLWNENNLVSFHEGVFLYAVGLAVFLVVLFTGNPVFTAFIRGAMVAIIGNFMLAIYKVYSHD